MRSATETRFRLSSQRITVRLAGFALFWSWAIHGCGPDFPNWLLDGRDVDILSAPIASFAAEIRKLDTPSPPYRAYPSPSGQQAVDTHDAELADLREALAERGLPSVVVDDIVRTHTAARGRLLDYRLRRLQWESQFAWIPNNAVPPPAFPTIPVASGLPEEFEVYFRGALAWHSGDTNAAQGAWAALLERPAAQRRFKSTWAAYMLGRSWEGTQPGKALRYYQLTRQYADAGLRDSAGLAAASLGREARVHYEAGRCDQAIALYLQQSAAGDPGALISLRWTAASALQKQYDSLPALARDPVARRVITAYLVSRLRPASVHVDGPIREETIHWLGRTRYFKAAAPGWHRYQPEAALWLEAVEKADIVGTEEADAFALAAYQAGEFETAARWLRCAPRTTLALWLQGKLLLRDGQVDQAAACLATVVHKLSESEKDGASGLEETALLDGAGFSDVTQPSQWRSVSEEALGELGALNLARGEYIVALDALLRSGFWMDAAYVAERVLTVDQLAAYVETHWPENPVSDGPGEQIRYLLARRLARLNRWTEARPFYPKAQLEALDALTSALGRGRDECVPNVDRADALWAAAGILRTNGMELIGTEGAPDWAIHHGNYNWGVSASDRTNSALLKPTEDELHRADQHVVVPDKRFHYRYQAWDLVVQAAERAWEGAESMPDNSDETARLLYTAGCWLKDRDPQAADCFYKALVIRCRKTALGRAADRKRWFPKPGEW